MPPDPFYEEILAGLNGPLDRDLFEACMTDLLRDTFPSLVPVRGGKDSGMDGAIADGEGEPYPLVATTAKDVKRNLTRSLDSLLKRKRPRRDRKSTRLNSSHVRISYAVFCLKKKKKK